MNNFEKTKFTNHGGYVTYDVTGTSLEGTDMFRKTLFVARFKRLRAGIGPFITFLIKNFTVEEYFARLVAGEAPLTILNSKGYIQPHIKAWLKEAGLPVTPEGFKALIERQVAARVSVARLNFINA
jgi:hypothetical protein